MQISPFKCTKVFPGLRNLQNPRDKKGNLKVFLVNF